MFRISARAPWCLPLLLLAACSQRPAPKDDPADAAVQHTADAGALDGSPYADAAQLSDAAQTNDAANPPTDAGALDATPHDGSFTDASASDGGATDGAAPDAATAPDGGLDGGSMTVFPPGCTAQTALPSNVTQPQPGVFVVAGPAFAVEVTPWTDHVVRLRYLGTTPATPARGWAVTGAPSTGVALRTGAQANGTFVLCTSALVVRVDAAGRVQVTDGMGTPVLDDTPGGFSETPQTGAHRLVRSAPAADRYLALGERTGGLNRRGHRHTFWNTDAFQDAWGGYPPDADPLYQSIPLLLGINNGAAWGVFTDNTYRMELDLAATATDQRVWDVTGGTVDQYVIAGPLLQDVVQRYGALTGRLPLPPRWSLGYHQSRWGYSPASRVVDVMAQLRARNLPADAIWLDIQHMDGFRSFTFDPVTFADPAGLVANAQQQGFHTVLIVDPGIKEDPAWDVYQQGIAGGHFLTTPAGAPDVGAVWPGPALWPDFTRPATRTWWGSLVARSKALGVAGLWIDMNEPSNFTGMAGGTVPNDLVANGDGTPTTLAEVHNTFGLHMARATWEGQRAAAPDQRPFVLTRAGYAGIQRYAAVWTGDAVSSWETLATTLPMMLNMALSGVAMVGSDVGGYSGNPGAELYARWMQLGSISPFFRGHVERSAPDQEPWAFGAEVEYISRTVMAQRYRLLPYLYSLTAQAAAQGDPILGPLVYHFQADPNVTTLEDQAMLGPWLLAAPVLAAGQTQRAVYLPAGNWMEYHSGAAYSGGTTVNVPVTLEALPLFVRAGAIIPHGPDMQFTQQLPLDPLQLDIHPAAMPTTFTLYEDDGISFEHQLGAYRQVAFTQRMTPTTMQVTAAAPVGQFQPPPRTMMVRIRPLDQAPTGVALDGAALPIVASRAALDGTGRGAFHDQNDRSLLVKFADAAPFVLDVSVDTALLPRPTVRVPVEVYVPTPAQPGDIIHIASSANGWAHQPLTWSPQMDRATGEVEVPRGQWFEYKYSRGDWGSVEKWSGCLEATNRYAQGAAHPGKSDRVDLWADRCP